MNSSRELLTVIVPCRNEENGLVATVTGILEHAKTLPVDLTVLMIDDGSTDRTRERIEELCARHSQCSIMVNEKNLGLGRSVLKSYSRIPDRSWVTVVPGDNELMFESIDNYLAVRDRYDLILGYLQNPVIRTAARRLASWAFTKVVNVIYGFPFRYLNGLKMYRVETFRGIEVVSSGHAFTAELVAKAQLRTPHLRIGEVPFAARGRAMGESKAFRPMSIVRAVGDVIAGARSVARYRDQVVRGTEQSRRREPA